MFETICAKFQGFEQLVAKMSSKQPQVCQRCRNDERIVIDYYWRDYIGQIPHDAVQGGHDRAHKSTYIAQGYIHRYGLLVGSIYSGSDGVKLAYSTNSSEHSRIAVKVLCSSHPNCFSWRKVNKNNLASVTIGQHLVVGGYEDNNLIHIGRAQYQGELIVGKVESHESQNAELRVAYGDKKCASFSDYEVLVYNVNSNYY